MGKEIERKFLVNDKSVLAGLTGATYRQGYLSSDPERVVRVRMADNSAYLTIKGASRGAVRAEFEYGIPVGDADELLALCVGPIVEKRRYRVAFQGKVWEIDDFLGENEGLCVAEIELDSEDETFRPPPWIGKEVTDDPRYYNVNLVKTPYGRWTEA